MRILFSSIFKIIKTTRRYHHTPVRMVIKKKMPERMWRKGMEISAAILEHSMEVSQSLQLDLSYVHVSLSWTHVQRK
jgi:hypothetical protein